MKNILTNLKPFLTNRLFRKFIYAGVFAGVTAVIVIALSNYEIKKSTRYFVYNTIDNLPYNNVALVPGTSGKLRNGNNNPYFDYRIKAATELFFSGKIKYIIVSGDNRTTNYNEPADMKRALILNGVPKDKIFTDYAGLRTFDSVVRCKEIFGQNSITIVSQQFQNERAIFIAQHKGMQAVALNAQDVSFSFGKLIQLRELLARVAVFTDLYVFNTKPRHSGVPIAVQD